MPPLTGLRVRCVTSRDDIARLVSGTLGEWLPDCVVERSVKLAGAVDAGVHCIVLDSPDAAAVAAAAVNGTPVVVLVQDVSAVSAGGAWPGADAVVPVAAVPRLLPGAVAALIAGSAGADAAQAARLALEETRRSIARGRAAATVQHAANNPLTALLTEAQLLELEPLSAEHLDTVRRIVELSRRTVAILRSLDAPREEP